MALIKLCRPQMEEDYDALKNRLHNIEQLNEDLQAALESGSLTVASAGTAGGQPAAKAEKKKELRPEAVPEDVRQVVSSWKQLVSRIPALDRTMLAEAKVSVSDSGALILAFSKQTPADYFRQEQHQNTLVEAAGQLTGKEITLDVRYVEGRQEMNALPELRNIIKGVEIEFED